MYNIIIIIRHNMTTYIHFKGNKDYIMKLLECAGLHLFLQEMYPDIIYVQLTSGHQFKSSEDFPISDEDIEGLGRIPQRQATHPNLSEENSDPICIMKLSISESDESGNSIITVRCPNKQNCLGAFVQYLRIILGAKGILIK